MSPSSPARRISYVIPPPAQSVPRLVLPRLGADRHGSTTPLFITAFNDRGADLSTPPPSNVEFGVHLHPKHRLGITSFALDTSTRLSGKPTPEGILYSGGRDGQVLAHELGIALRQRSKPYGDTSSDGKGPARSWETITGWGDIEEDIEEEQTDRKEPEIPFENSWEINQSVKESALKLSFRQSMQSHSDWINDILLCNFNRTIVSCSSDETVKAWNPHDGAGTSDTVVLGRHMDYVQCLAHAKKQKWVASGGFDRMIKLWDLNREHQDPIITFSPPEESNTKASVYAIATDAVGSFIASGSPEKVIRMWDPRSGKRTGKLVGHTDNIRSILISENGRYVLTGSADASIKLWSLASANRCIHTFSHHTESVWSLHSDHPSLSIFYSGDRGGHVCRVDTEGCSSLSEGECVLLCKETPSSDSLGTEGITSLTVLDDQFVWTATSSSTINCWRVPGTRSSRIADLATSPGETDAESSPPITSDFANTVSPYGFSMDSIQPSTLRSRQRDSFNTEKEGWPRSESPSSLSDTPTRNIESPSGIRPRNTGKGNNTISRDSATFPNPSDSSVYTAGGQPQVAPATLNALFGVPYQSLIKLSSPVDGFISPLFGRPKDPDVATLYSAASIRSVPIPMRQVTLKAQAESFRPINLAQPPLGLNSVLPRSMPSMDGNTYGSVISTGHPGHKTVQSVDEIEDAARIAYEAREIAPEAVPVRERPDYVLHGTQGIVRSVVLNDRWHALTVDTMGHVGVWDIVRGECVGMFEKCDVEKANECESTSDGQKWKWSPREALEVVRERIEGEAVVNAWCTVDSSIGNLMVHIESNRAFDAEIFADEAGYHGDIKFEEDHRLNIGKWVIGNMFASFVIQEQTVQAEPGYFVDTLTSELLQSPPGLGRAGISRQGGPRHISLEARRIRSIAEIAASQRTPGTVALAAIATMTPAVLPDLPTNATERITAASGRTGDVKATKVQEHGEHNGSSRGETYDGVRAMQSPSIGSPTPRLPQRSQTVDESSAGHFDYFSVRRRSSVGGDENAAATSATTGNLPPPHDETPSSSAASAANTQPAPQVTPTTPAAVASLKFMGKLKAFGKPKKTGGATEANESSDATTAATNADSEAAIAKPPTPTIFETLMLKPFVLPAFSDVPPIQINPMTGITISQASSEAASGWAPVYRGLYSTQSESEDVDILEQELPSWVLEFLLNNKVGGVVGGGGPGGSQKFNFMVVPWKGAEAAGDLPDLLSNQSRLTASRFLRVRKILSYVKDKVDMIEKADKRKASELQLVGEGDTVAPPSREGTPRVPSPKSLRSSSRSSHEGATVPVHKPSSKPVAGANAPGGSAPAGHTARPRATSSSSSRSGATVHHHASSRNRKASRATIEEERATERRPEDLYELLCNGMLLPNEMTLAAVKQYRWKGAGELVMEYRRRRA